MMRRGFYRIIGILIILAALVGLVISIGGIAGVWQVRSMITANLNNTLGMLEQTLTATSDALKVAQTSLDQAITSVDTLSATIQTTGKSVHDTLPLFNSLNKLTTQDLPGTIETTQKALDSAKSSAEVIDSTLALVTSFPLLPMQPYKPDVPLGVALSQVSTSLEPLPESISSMGEPITNLSANVSTMEGQFNTIAQNIGDINTSLTQAKNVITQYQTVISTLKSQVTSGKNNLPIYVQTMAWLFTVVLIWLGLTQVGLLFQGFEMFSMGLAERREAAATVSSATD